MGVGQSYLNISMPNESCGDFDLYVSSADGKKEKYLHCSPNGNYSCKVFPQTFLTREGNYAKLELPDTIQKEKINITCELLDSTIANDIGCACNITDFIKYTETTDDFGQKCLKQAADNTNFVVAIVFGIVSAILVIVLIVVLCIKCNCCTPIRNCFRNCCRRRGGQAKDTELKRINEQKKEGTNV